MITESASSVQKLMEIAVNNVSSLVRGWLSTPSKASSKPLPLYQPISPRPERLGLGADLSAINTQPRIVTTGKVWQSVNGNGKKQFRLPPRSDPELQAMQNFSDDDNSCSRSAVIGSAKRNHPPTSFNTKMAQSRKRRRRRKKNKTDNLSESVKVIKVDDGNGESVHNTSLLKLPAASDVKTSVRTTMLDDHSHAHSAIDESLRLGETFQLFVHMEGGSEGEETTCVLEQKQQELKRNQHEKNLVVKRRQALRGGSAHYCDKRVTKRLLKKGLCETKQYPSTKLSNSSTSSTSMGTPVSNSVSKQLALYEGTNDRLKGKELTQSPTLPVDIAFIKVAHYEASMTDREVSMEQRRHRRRVMRYRKRTRITQKPSLIKRLYLQKV